MRTLKKTILLNAIFLFFINLQAQEKSWSVGPLIGIQFSESKLYDNEKLFLNPFDKSLSFGNGHSKTRYGAIIGFQCLKHSKNGDHFRGAVYFEERSSFVVHKIKHVTPFDLPGTIKLIGITQNISLDMEFFKNIVKQNKWGIFLGFGTNLTCIKDREIREFEDDVLIFPSSFQGSLDRQAYEFELGISLSTLFSLRLYDKTTLNFLAFAKQPIKNLNNKNEFNREYISAYNSLSLIVSMNYAM